MVVFFELPGKIFLLSSYGVEMTSEDANVRNGESLALNKLLREPAREKKVQCYSHRVKIWLITAQQFRW